MSYNFPSKRAVTSHREIQNERKSSFIMTDDKKKMHQFQNKNCKREHTKIMRDVLKFPSQKNSHRSQANTESIGEFHGLPVWETKDWEYWMTHVKEALPGCPIHVASLLHPAPHTVHWLTPIFSKPLCSSSCLKVSIFCIWYFET